jgi:hypothetical protein
MSRNECLLRYGRCQFDRCSRCSVWFSCNPTQLSASSKIPSVTQISWQAFCTHCSNASKLLIGIQYAKVFTCLHSKRSRGLRSRNRAGQLTGPPPPIHCSPKVWFRCCVTKQTKRRGPPSCMYHMCCRWWRDTSSKSTGKSCAKIRWYTAPLSLLDKTTDPKGLIT